MKRRLRIPAVALAAVGLLTGVAIAASSPSVTTGSATAVHANSAQLNGTVNPNGAATLYHFEWGLTSTYGLGSVAASAGKGTSKVNVKTTAKALLPGTTYHYRLVAGNSSGVAVGKDRTFRTTGNPPPVVATGPATGVTKSSAILTGVVNPQGANTTWAFQYGLTTGYQVQTFGGVVAAGAAPVSISEKISGLSPGTTFHYRLVALHSNAPAQFAGDAAFQTLPSPRPVPKIRASTSPGRDRRAPFVFTTTGKIRGPRSTPPNLDCVDSATVQLFLGRRRVASTSAPIQPDCSFAAQTRLRKLPGRGPKGRTVRLRVVVRFRGNGYLAPVTARAQTVTLG